MLDEFLRHPEFHRRVQQSLALEWRLAAAVLPPLLRRSWREPGFALADTQATLGSWHPTPVREIRIALRCVVEHPWYAVIEVLRHEMAHQLADEVLGPDADGETSHGPVFRRACCLLHANPAASGAYPTLDALVLGDVQSPHDRMLRRVRKLLALGESPNRHEAEQAVAKARELLARYGTELPPETNADGYVSICLGEPSLRHGLEMHALASLVREHYPVRTIWVPMAVPKVGKLGRALEVNGTPLHVRSAHDVFTFIRAATRREWAAYRGDKRLGTNGYRDFALGMIAGFRAILERQTETSPCVRAMVRRSDPVLDRYFAERHPQQRQTKVGRGVAIDPDLHREGNAVAARIGLRRPVDNRSAAAAVLRLGPGRPAQERG